MNPAGTVVAAMPGTVAELSERTGYPVGQVERLIVRARAEGHRVNATMQPRDDGGEATTIFVVDSRTQLEEDARHG